MYMLKADFLHDNLNMQMLTKVFLFQFIDYLQNESLYIEVWGRQKGKGGGQPAPIKVTAIGI